MVDAKWLVLLPLGPTLAFVLWVLWNLSREIGARRRTYAGGKRYRTKIRILHRTRKSVL